MMLWHCWVAHSLLGLRGACQQVVAWHFDRVDLGRPVFRPFCVKAACLTHVPASSQGCRAGLTRCLLRCPAPKRGEQQCGRTQVQRSTSACATARTAKPPPLRLRSLPPQPRRQLLSSVAARLVPPPGAMGPKASLLGTALLIAAFLLATATAEAPACGPAPTYGERSRRGGRRRAARLAGASALGQGPQRRIAPLGS